MLRLLYPFFPDPVGAARRWHTPPQNGTAKAHFFGAAQRVLDRE